MSTKLFGDFETASAVDLKTAGVHSYALDASTFVWCFAFAFDDGPKRLWTPGEPLPDDVRQHIESGGLFIGHNVGFEWHIWNFVCVPRYGWPPLKIEQCDCTAARAAAMALPRSLEKAAPAVGIDARKDDAGHRLMLQMAKPRREDPGGQYVWWDDETRRKRLYEYCLQDIEVERELDRRLLALRPLERKIWLLDHAINMRGIRIDAPLVAAAEKIVEQAMKRLNRAMSKATGGEVSACTNVSQLLAFVRRHGVDADSVDKESLADLLDTDQDLPFPVRQALELRREAAKTSTAKLRAMRLGASPDGRVRGVHLYCGAGPGRWSSLRVQTQNMMRPTMKQPAIEAALDTLKSGDADLIELIDGPPLEVVANCVRSMIVPDKGRRFIAADYANIEGRVIAWLAGQDDLVEIFRNNGPVYERMAAAIFNVPVEKVKKDSFERQVGKTAVLGCGYGMGAEKFKATCKKNGIAIDSAMAQRTIDTYREKNFRIKQFWYDLENAALEAVREPGTTVRAGRTQKIAYLKKGSFLFCQLPSGRLLTYAYPTIRDKETPWGEMRPALFCMGVNSMTKKWEEWNPYSGLLAENVTQAIARDMLAEAMLRLEAAGYPVVMHIHDEIVAEPKIGHGSLEEFCRIMTTSPAWGRGCPVAAAGWEGNRYRKG